MVVQKKTGEVRMSRSHTQKNYLKSFSFRDKNKLNFG
jgi:hypothetical protein